MAPQIANQEATQFQLQQAARVYAGGIGTCFNKLENKPFCSSARLRISA
jgi:hypothetical protein